MHARIHGRTRGLIGDFEVDDFVLQPFFEIGNAVVQVAAGLELRVLEGEDVDSGERVRDQGAEMVGEVVEGMVVAFEAVDEDEEKGVFLVHGWLHFELCVVGGGGGERVVMIKLAYKVGRVVHVTWCPRSRM